MALKLLAAKTAMRLISLAPRFGEVIDFNQKKAQPFLTAFEKPLKTVYLSMHD